MKILQKIEKSNQLLFLSGISFLFFLLRLPSLIEPYWYGDEGIYELIGRALNNGRMLYSQIWDNKPPLLYLVHAIANGDQYAVRFLSIIFGVGSVILFYFLSRKLFKSRQTVVITTVLYALLFATPLLEGNIANAENFMLFPIIAAAYIVYKNRHFSTLNSHFSFFIAGLLLGIAFLFKIVALFDFAAFFIFLSFVSLPSIKLVPGLPEKLLNKLLIFALGFLLPIGLTIVYFLIQGSLVDFIQATFFGNISYISYKNKLIIAQGFLILKLLILFIAVYIIFQKRKIIPAPVMFALLWFFFSVFNAFFSGRGWVHYLLVLLPSSILLLGFILERTAAKLKLSILGLLLLLLYSVNTFFHINMGTISKTLKYYQNFYLFVTDQKSAKTYQEYFDAKVPRDYALAQFISRNTKPNDNVFIWGNNPQIYVLSNTLPPGKYTVEYHITQNQKALKQTAFDIEHFQPKFIIILSEMKNFPFGTGMYTKEFSIEGAEIYERTF